MHYMNTKPLLSKKSGHYCKLLAYCLLKELLILPSLLKNKSFKMLI